ncbi:MAG: carbohydrate binding domain-containing protein [Clostridia bacterium]|nr:carbohydrate binding domain-containing protein [Clostridia bacterium]
MKTTKLFALLITLLMLFTNHTIALAAEDLVINGGFETTDGEGVPEGWSFSGSSFGESFSLTDDGYTGKALKIQGSESSLYAIQRINGISAGQVYKCSVRFKSVQNNGMVLKLEFSGSVNEATELTISPKEPGTWERAETVITVPFGATKVSVLLRMFGGGECYYDDMSMVPTGEVKKVEFVEATTTPPDGITLKDGEINFIYNPSFEALKADGSAMSWNNVGTGGVIVDEGRSGNSVYIKSEKGGGSGISQRIDGIIPGETYTLTLWAKIVSGSVPNISIQFTNKSGETTEYLESGKGKNVTLETNGAWEQGTVTFTAPEKADSATVQIRFFHECDCYLDDITFVGKSTIQPIVEEEVEFSEPIDGKYLLSNGGFENGTEGLTCYKGWDGGYVSISDENVHSGKYALKIKTLNNAWACFKSIEIDPGATYEIQTWYNTYTTGALFKIECYDENGTYLKGAHTTQFGSSKGEWKKITYVLPIPKEAARIDLFCRTFSHGEGTLYYDDVQIVKVGEPRKLSLETDRVFFYTDAVEDGSAMVTPNMNRFPEIIGSKLVFEIMDGNNTLSTEETVISADKKEYRFKINLDLLTEKQKQYQAKVTLYAQDGTCVETATQNIYKYDRPNYLTRDGIYSDETGEFIPTFAYHIKPDRYETIKPLGVNLFQTYTGDSKKSLDTIHEMGGKLLYVLYGGMHPAGHPDNIEKAIKAVEAYKDHPGLFGWILMDEPSVYSLEPETDSWLEEGYKIVRERDPNHPVFIVDNSTSKFSPKYADIVAYDLYISGAASLKKVTEYTNSVHELSLYDKPVYGLLLWGKTGSKVTTVDAIRNQTYQAYYAGAFGVGGYTDDGADFCLDYGEHQEEMNDAYRHFVLGEYPIFCDYNGENVKYRAYVKDGAIYLAVFSIGSAATQTVDVDLTSLDGSVVLNGFTSELLAGGSYLCDTTAGGGDLNDAMLQIGDEVSRDEAVQIIQGKYEYKKEEHTGHNMTVTVGLANAAYYKITPNEPIDVQKLVPVSRFKDLNDYSWAREAITRLDEQGIVNDIGAFGYGPARNITRGELAMFLVRTLGLTGNSTDNFSDVDANAEYADEIAIGKAQGILQGVGDNQFNPDAPITRQDLMTMISRGLQLSGDADLSGFSDGGTVADYAVEHVKAMIASGLIQGNADKTLNPIGNTTRAEAAVIMLRLQK